MVVIRKGKCKFRKKCGLYNPECCVCTGKGHAQLLCGKYKILKWGKIVIPEH